MRMIPFQSYLVWFVRKHLGLLMLIWLQSSMFGASYVEFDVRGNGWEVTNNNEVLLPLYSSHRPSRHRSSGVECCSQWSHHSYKDEKLLQIPNKISMSSIVQVRSHTSYSLQSNKVEHIISQTVTNFACKTLISELCPITWSYQRTQSD